ncbi:MAG: DUF3108 domain-containing protein [Candidatus Angelobacter sp.]
MIRLPGFTCACRVVAITIAGVVMVLGQTRPAAQPRSSGQAVLSAPSITGPPPGYRFPVGQTYVYAAQWRIFDAGTATLRMEQAGAENRVVATADATSAVALLYHVQDRLEAFFDPNTFCSRAIFRHTEEGFRRVETSVSFDYQHGKSVLDQKNIRKNEHKHEEHNIAGCVTDLLSGIYYVASLPLETGRMFTFPLNDGGETVMVNARVEGVEQIKTPAGTFNTLRVQPEATSGVLKEKGRVWVWYADDASHTPVQMRARMYWGTLTLTLQRIEKK